MAEVSKVSNEDREGGLVQFEGLTASKQVRFCKIRPTPNHNPRFDQLQDTARCAKTTRHGFSNDKVLYDGITKQFMLNVYR